MRVLKKQFSAATLAMVAIFCLTGSSRAFVTRVDGSLAGDVSFRFYLPGNDVQPTKLRIVEFIVQEQRSENRWTTAWWIEGEQSVNRIIYGAKYDGLPETAPAKPLVRGTKYRALVSERARLKPTGYSAVYFIFNEDGNVLTTGP